MGFIKKAFILEAELQLLGVSPSSPPRALQDVAKECLVESTAVKFRAHLYQEKKNNAQGEKPVVEGDEQAPFRSVSFSLTIFSLMICRTNKGLVNTVTAFVIRIKP